VERITDLGATLVALSPGRTAQSRALIEKKQLTFDILRDAGNQVADAYGLRWSLPEDLRGIYRRFGIDLAEINGENSWTLPLPARFILDAGGVVRDARVDPDYTRRPEPEETLEALERLRND